LPEKLPADAFARRLPLAAPAKRRLQIEALLFASDVMHGALLRIMAVAAQCGLDARRLSEARTQLISDAWMIVDRVHDARLIFSALLEDGRGPRQDAWFAATESAWAMRNAMDHLGQNAGNHAAKKGLSTPLFGSLSYSYVSPADTLDAISAAPVHAVVLGAGSAPNGKMTMSVRAPFNRQLWVPVGSVVLEAFDRQLELDRAVFDLLPLLEGMSSSLKEQFDGHAERESRRLGIPLEDCYSGLPKDLVWVMRFERVAAGEGSPSGLREGPSACAEGPG